MNPDILQKCVDELKKEQPNIQYILGILETIIQIGGVKPPFVGGAHTPISIDPRKLAVARGENTAEMIAEESRLDPLMEKYLHGTEVATLA